MTLKQRNLVRILTGLSDTNVFEDSDIDTFLEWAEDEDDSGGDDKCIALLAASKIARSQKWLEVVRQSDGLAVQSADTFTEMLKDRLTFLQKYDPLISQETYEENA